MYLHLKTLACILFVWIVLTACAPVQPTPAAPTSTLIPTTTPQRQPQAVDLGLLGKGSASAVAWSPDGKLLAVISTLGIYLYDTQTWQVVKTISKAIFGGISFGPAAFSFDEKSLIIPVSNYTAAAFWRYDLQTDQAAPWLAALSLHPQEAPVFSPDGKIFAFLNLVCGKTTDGGQPCVENLELRENDTGKLLASIPTNALEWEKRSRFFVFSPDGKQLAAANQPNRVTLWDTLTGKQLYEFQHDSVVTGLSFSPDGTTLILGLNDGRIQVWGLPAK